MFAGSFPDMKEKLLFFMNSFDRTKAKKEGVIIPNRGMSDLCIEATVSLINR